MSDRTIEYIGFDPNSITSDPNLMSKLKPLTQDMDLVTSWLALKSGKVVKEKFPDDDPSKIQARTALRANMIGALLENAPWMRLSQTNQVQKALVVPRQRLPDAIFDMMLACRFPKSSVRQLEPVVGQLRNTRGEENYIIFMPVTIYTKIEQQHEINADLANVYFEVRVKALDGDNVQLDTNLSNRVFSLGSKGLGSKDRQDLSDFLKHAATELLGPVDIPI